jgi:hypothetical protein
MLVRIDERTKGLDAKYVRRDEFLPVQKIVYGLTGIVLVSMLAALLALVLRTR